MSVVDLSGNRESDTPPPATSCNWRESAINAADLRHMTFTPARFVVPGYVPEGVTLLIGRPKIGKSWLGLDLAIACAGDQFVLGSILPVRGDVLYLALEDGMRRLQRRLDKLMPTAKWPNRLTLVTMGRWRRADQGGLADIEAWCKSVSRPVLIVIDTLERFRKPANGKQQLYSHDYEAITGLQRIATEYGIAIVVLHHDRKMEGDDPFDTVSGTLGLTGAADTILIFKRRSNGVVLYARGRDIEEVASALKFEKETCRWTLLGVASEVHRSNERTRIITALKSASQPLSAKEIMVDAEMRNRNATDVLLSKMAKNGEIDRVGRGQYTLAAESTNDGQIGKKESSGPEPIGAASENSDLSDLSNDCSDVPPGAAEAI